METNNPITQGRLITGKDARKYDRANWHSHFLFMKILKMIRLQQGESLLDVGCGTGSVLMHLLKQHGDSVKLFGSDPSMDMIELAKAKNAKKEGSIRFDVAAGERLPYESAKFDWVMSSLTFHHIPREAQMQTAREMYRVLKPGGNALVCDLGRARGILGHLIFPRIKNHAFVPETSKGSIVAALSEAGFQNPHTSAVQFGVVEYITAVK